MNTGDLISEGVFRAIVYSWTGLAVLAVPLLFKVTAPYGRHASPSWGPMMESRAGWLVMEWTVPPVFLFFFLSGSNTHGAVSWVFFSLWALHYANRSLVYPFRQKTKGKRIPIVVVVAGVLFNLVNMAIVGHFLGSVRAFYDVGWFHDPRFIIGLVLFLAGLSVNWWSDNVLLNLRKPGEDGYRIPRSGLFELVSCPNHLGEIVEWFGFAVMVWGLPMFAFALWTAVNLIPRALSHHRWYGARFEDYPEERKALIPFVL